MNFGVYYIDFQPLTACIHFFALECVLLRASSIPWQLQQITYDGCRPLDVESVAFAKV